MVAKNTPGNLLKPRTKFQHVIWEIGIFGHYFRQFVKTRLAYRVDFLVDTLAVSFALVIQLAVLGVLFSKVESLKGWSYHEVLFIYGFSLVPLGIFNLTSVNLYRFSDRFIIQGKFDRVLLRPVSSLGQVMCESFNIAGLNEIIIGSAVMFYSGTKLQMNWELADVLAVLILGPSASLVYTGVFLGLTSVSFWFEDRMGLAPPVYNMIRFARYPITIFGGAVRFFLTFVIPFAWVAFYPASWFLGNPEFSRLALLTPLVSFVVFGGAVLLWRSGVQNYSSTGS
ncbi:MAG: ABC transporter permease [bacterium]|nr:ABC transporter permease [bacterium]